MEFFKYLWPTLFLKGWRIAPTIFFFYLTGCSSPMTVKTVPPEAKTYVDVKYIGLSPATCDGRGWLWGKREVLVMKQGYEATIKKVERVPREPVTTLQKTLFRPAYLGSWYWPDEVFIELEKKTEEP